MGKILEKRWDRIILVGTCQDNAKALKQLIVFDMDITLLPLPFDPSTLGNITGENFFAFLSANSLDKIEKNCVLCFHDSEYADILLDLFSTFGGYQRNRNIFLTNDFISDYINTTILELSQTQQQLSRIQTMLDDTMRYNEALLHSASWRITKPLRTAKNMLRRKNR
jgi:hypothetical protein